VYQNYQSNMVSLELEARLDNLLATAQAETAHIDLFLPINIQEREECPICMIPLPLSESELTFMTCCGKKICMGCTWKEVKNSEKKGLRFEEQICAFCRRPEDENPIKSLKKLMKKKNPTAFIRMGIHYKEGDGVFQSDTKALEMFICSAELGHADAYSAIGIWYQGLGTVLERDLSKAVAFDKVAAKKGAVIAHLTLAHFYTNTGDNNKRIKHLTVAARAGDKDAMGKLMDAYRDKQISKEELSQTLRASQASINEMKSKDRDDASLLEEARQKGEAPPAHLLM